LLKEREFQMIFKSRLEPTWFESLNITSLFKWLLMMKQVSMQDKNSYNLKNYWSGKIVQSFEFHSEKQWNENNFLNKARHIDFQISLEWILSYLYSYLEQWSHCHH
jgi:hypothetical protein